MNKKTTDAEIKKALEWYVSKFKKVGFVYMDADGTKLVSTQDVLDLINRLQADVDNYKQIAENQQKIILDKAFENKRLREKVESLQADVERLEAECEEQYESAEATIRAEIASGGTSCHWCEDKVRIEAYKECIEKVKEKSCKLNMCHNDIVVKTDYQISGEKLDTISKELVGDK